MSIKKRVFDILERNDEKDFVANIFSVFILVLILMSMMVIILQSFSEIATKYEKAFNIFEVVTVTVFTLEYLLRLWTADLKYQQIKKYQARVKYALTFMALVDLLAIVPFYLPMFISVDLRFIRIIRLTRLLRILKLNRYSKALTLIAKVFKERKDELFSTVFIMFLVILISSTMMYYIENGVQPEAFPNIIATFQWAIATLTTVGYGDVYPITPLGKVLASIIALTGIGLVALPTGIISSGFMEEMKPKNELTCPHCGKKIE